MRGKNTRKRAIPAIYKGRRSAVALRTRGQEHSVEGTGLPEGSGEDRSGCLTLHHDALPPYGYHHHLGLTPLTANAFPFVTFPEEIDNNARNMLCIYFTRLKNTMYPIARYSRSDSSSNTYWFDWTQLDLAYLHSILFTTSFFYDNVQGQTSERTRYHSYRTIHELNKQLAHAKTAVTESTTTVVMAIALMAGCFGDTASAHMHMMGLKRIVELRGGIESYSSYPLLQAKLSRAGLVYSSCTGAEPVFCEGTPSYDSAFDHLPELIQLKPLDATCVSRSRALVRTLDRRLYNAFKDVQCLSRLINDSYNSGHKIPEMALEGLLTSVQARLLSLQFDNRGNNTAELLRLSLVAYLTTVFWSLPGLKFDYPHLAAQFRKVCLGFSPTATGEGECFAWALTVGAISLFNGRDRDWLLQILHPLIRDHLGTTWAEVRKSLGHIMWIGSIHDDLASEVFRSYLEDTGTGDAVAVE
ncbi:Putative fungal transcription factor [Colletotrichum destructivum]|uniref:Fungal transcription factor n=1 Tax=Colletotrichum destructivum TaxID=34406 RepID=A0AAX4IWW0_9PEZI|nr:Putative fungal transcription factor [Colletotrichum destructivum]